VFVAFSPIPFCSRSVTFDTSATKSVESALLSFPDSLSTKDAGLLSSPSILLILKAHLSSMGLEPNDEDGDGSG